MPRLHTDHTRLTGPERQQFGELLLDAFGLDGFDNLLANRLGLRRERISLARSLDAIVYDVIDDAEMKSYSAELLQAARAERQTNVSLFRFAQQFTLEPSLAIPERLIRSHLGEIDPEPWLTLALERIGQVCRIVIPSAATTGTGFLVAPDLVLTNYHILEKAIERQITGQLIQLFFDQRLQSKDRPIRLLRLPSKDWLVASSPNADLLFDGPTSPALDYALLRIDGRPGDDIVDSAQGQRRGWIPLSPIPAEFVAEMPLLLLGHPRGDSLKLTLDTQSLIGLGAGGSRLRYRTNSEPGSSGSPCFDLHWNLVALHHAGDPNQPPRWNEGIPLAALQADWVARLASGKLNAVQEAALSGLLTQTA